MFEERIYSIALKDIRKTYHSSQFALVVNNLEFHNRNIYAVVGLNGSGKSTLLKIIALLDMTHEGSLLFNDTDALLKNGSYKRLRKKIGFVMQSPYLFNTDVIGNVALGLKIRGYSKNEIVSKVKNVLKTLKIGYLAERNIKHLSRGEYQKVAIAQTLVLQPEIILMDEPVANIDAETTLSIEETIKNIQERLKCIVIITTHSLSQAYRISSRVVSLKEGRVANSTEVLS